MRLLADFAALHCSACGNDDGKIEGRERIKKLTTRKQAGEIFCPT